MRHPVQLGTTWTLQKPGNPAIQVIFRLYGCALYSLKLPPLSDWSLVASSRAQRLGLAAAGRLKVLRLDAARLNLKP